MKLSWFFIFLLIIVCSTDHNLMAAENIVSNETFHADISKQQTEPFIFVVFGATGDLTERKLLPAFYHLALEGHLPNEIAFVGLARRQNTDIDFRKKMGEAIDQFSFTKSHKSAFWNDFQKLLFYQSSDCTDDQTYEKLQELLAKIDKSIGTQGNRIYFLATHPKFFPIIIEKLKKHHLIKDPSSKKPWSRVMIEKPFGSDLGSAIHLQNHLVKFLDESQIFRMDHYLGKEGVQNFLTFRFESGLLEPIWNKEHIDHVQITLAEEIGIGSRARFWEETGTLRDIFQNHLMQLLAVVAMERPIDLQATSIKKEKLKVLNAIRPFALTKNEDEVVRGQYGNGVSKGFKVRGYREEEGVSASSATETFVAAKIYIDNDRWKGVPFYIRGGKRLAKQTTEIAVTFKKKPFSLRQEANTLFIRIQPEAGIYLKTLSKVPGLGHKLLPVVFGYQSEAFFEKISPEAYEKLIFDCAKGDNSFFVDAEEQLAAWRLLTPVLDKWGSHLPENFPNYEAGTWGPNAAERLLNQQGHHWQLLEY